MPTDPVLVVHGGAWAMPDDMVEAHLHGVRNALAAGWRVLERGGPALDAIEEAVVIMEDDETFDAGRGSFLNRDGQGADGCADHGRRYAARRRSGMRGTIAKSSPSGAQDSE